MENLNEISTIADVQLGKSYTMDSGDAKLEKVNATKSDSIKFATYYPKNDDGTPDTSKEPFKRMNGCYTSLFFTFDESDGRGGHQEKFFFDMDYDNLLKCVAKIKHIFQNTDNSGSGKIDLIGNISLNFNMQPLLNENNEEVIVKDETQLSQVYEMTDGKPLMFKRVGKPIDSGRIKNGKATTFQMKKVYTCDVDALRNTIQKIAEASQGILGTEFYLDFENGCSINPA